MNLTSAGSAASSSAFGPGPIGSARMSFSGSERNKLFRRQGSTWLEETYLSGADSVLDGRVAVRADFDRDGDEDIAVVSRNAPILSLFRNESMKPARKPPVIGLRITGAPKDRSNRDAIGATARLTGCGSQLRVVVGSDGFSGQSSRQMTFAADPTCDAPHRLSVTWPSGRTRRFDAVVPGFLYDLDEEGALTARKGHYQIPRTVEVNVATAEAQPWIDLLPSRKQHTLQVLVLWASWCAACKSHLPVLHELDAANGTSVVGITVEPRDTQDVVTAYRKTNNVRFSVGAYDEALATGVLSQFDDRLPPLPSSVLIADGVPVWAGPGLPTQSQIVAAQSKLDKPTNRSTTRRQWWLALAGTLIVIVLAVGRIAARVFRRSA